MYLSTLIAVLQCIYGGIQVCTVPGNLRFATVFLSKLNYNRLSPFGQITNAARSSLRSIFFGPNSFSVKAISKAITSAVRPPFRTTVTFLWQNGKFTLVIAVKWVFSIYRYDHFGRGFFILKNCHLCFPYMYSSYITNMANNFIIIWWR